MISIFSAYYQGIKNVLAYKKIVLLFYLPQLILAYLISKPFSSLISKTFSNTTLDHQLLNQFNLKYILFMIREYGQNIELFGLFFPLLIIYIFICIFLTAGTFWLFYFNSAFKMSEFLNRCYTYFTRFLKLYLFSLLFYILVLIIIAVIHGLTSDLTENAITEIPSILLSVSKLILFLILITVVMMVFDYAKIIIINEGAVGLFSTFFESLKFLMMNLVKTFGIYFLYFLSFLILFFIYNMFDNLINTNNFFNIALFFLIAQLFIFSRQFLRLSLYKTLIIYYQETNTAMPGMLTKEMMDMAVENYEKRVEQESDSSN